MFTLCIRLPGVIASDQPGRQSVSAYPSAGSVCPAISPFLLAALLTCLRVRLSSILVVAYVCRNLYSFPFFVCPWICLCVRHSSSSASESVVLAVADDIHAVSLLLVSVPPFWALMFFAFAKLGASMFCFASAWPSLLYAASMHPFVFAMSSEYIRCILTAVRSIFSSVAPSSSGPVGNRCPSQICGAPSFACV